MALTCEGNVSLFATLNAAPTIQCTHRECLTYEWETFMPYEDHTLADKLADKAHSIVKMTDTTVLSEHTFQNAQHGILGG